jgi:hypothetical protein
MAYMANSFEIPKHVPTNVRAKIFAEIHPFYIQNTEHIRIRKDANAMQLINLQYCSRQRLIQKMFQDGYFSFKNLEKELLHYIHSIVDVGKEFIKARLNHFVAYFLHTLSVFKRKNRKNIKRNVFGNTSDMWSGPIFSTILTVLQGGAYDFAEHLQNLDTDFGGVIDTFTKYVSNNPTYLPLETLRLVLL